MVTTRAGTEATPPAESAPSTPIKQQRAGNVAVSTSSTSNKMDQQQVLTKSRNRSSSKTREDVDAKYAVDLATLTTDENVFLFVPNLIGYSRVVLAAFALYYMPYHPKACTLLYGVSCLLDAVDGMAARSLNQTSKFGAVLDMVTDRCTTSCLLCFLAAGYPKYALVFQGLISLDFASHYMHMYSSLATGSASHKTVTSEVSRILWYYYNDSRTLFFVCFCNELFYVCLYLNKFYSTPLLPSSWTEWIVRTLLGTTASHPEKAWKLIHTFPGWTNLIVWSLKQMTWPQILAVITGPICFLKNVINVVQFWKASKILVGLDLHERAVARSKKSE